MFMQTNVIGFFFLYIMKFGTVDQLFSHTDDRNILNFKNVIPRSSLNENIIHHNLCLLSNCGLFTDRFWPFWHRSFTLTSDMLQTKYGNSWPFNVKKTLKCKIVNTRRPRDNARDIRHTERRLPIIL